MYLTYVNGSATGECVCIAVAGDGWSSVPFHPIGHLSAFHSTAGYDYTPGPYSVSFTAGQMYATLMVATLDDNTTELSEYFKAVINSTDQPSVVDIVSPTSTCITIEDDDPGMCAQPDCANKWESRTHVQYVCILWLLVSLKNVVYTQWRDALCGYDMDRINGVVFILYSGEYSWLGQPWSW